MPLLIGPTGRGCLDRELLVVAFCALLLLAIPVDDLC